MKFAYRGYDRAGAASAGEIEAGTPGEAIDLLRRRGLFVVGEPTPAGSGARAEQRGNGGGGGGGGGRGRGGRLRDMSVFVRQLSVLVSTGTPVVDAIAALERPVPSGRWRAALEDIRHRMEEGSPLSMAIEHHPAYFDGVACSLIAAGESGGNLAEMLRRLAQLARQQVKVRQAVLGALAYPCVLIVIAVTVLTVMLFFVLPRFEGLFQSLGSPLPPTTRALVDLSKALATYWYGPLALAVVGGFGLRAWVKTAGGRRMLHMAAVRVPPLNKLVRALVTARAIRVLGVLLAGRVPMLEALGLTRRACGNLMFEEVFQRAEELVTKGDNVSSALAASGLFPSAVVEGARSGERSGQLAQVLMDMAEFMDEDNEVVLRSVSSLIEPLILAVLGLVIGFVAVSMFLPLFDLAGATGGPK